MMSRFASTFLTYVVFVTALVSLGDAALVYSDTLLCASHKTKFCLSYSETLELFVLTKDPAAFARFDVTSSSSDSSQLTLSSGGMCVSKTEYLSYTSLTLSSCNSAGVLFLTFTDLEVSTNTFSLETFSSDPSCVSLAYKSSPDTVSVTKKRVQLHTNVPVILETCQSDYSYGQSLSAVDFSTSAVSLKNEITASKLKSLTRASDVEPRFGFYCLIDKPELCLGVSLTNGTDLESDKFVQIKNLTKNSLKDLEHYKLEWYRNYYNTSSTADSGSDLVKTLKLANAAQLDYCLEALYDVYTGDNRKGIKQYDDVLHLGFCDDLKKNNSVSSDNLVSRSLNGDSQNTESEVFSLVPKSITSDSQVINFLEIQTVKPGTSEVLCATVVKCVLHDNDHCVPYSSVQAETVSDLSQGAHVRLKACDSENLVSQRFEYQPDYVETDPPIYVPTPKPTFFPTKNPTEQPTNYPTTKSPTTKSPTTKSPTSFPTAVPETGEEKPPTSSGPDQDPSTINDKHSNAVKNKSWFKGLMAFIAVFCFILLLVLIIVAAKRRREDDKSSTRSGGSYSGVPTATTENTNFVARV